MPWTIGPINAHAGLEKYDQDSTMRGLDSKSLLWNQQGTSWTEKQMFWTKQNTLDPRMQAMDATMHAHAFKVAGSRCTDRDVNCHGLVEK